MDFPLISVCDIVVPFCNGVVTQNGPLPIQRIVATSNQSRLGYCDNSHKTTFSYCRSE